MLRERTGLKTNALAGAADRLKRGANPIGLCLDLAFADEFTIRVDLADAVVRTQTSRPTNSSMADLLTG